MAATYSNGSGRRRSAGTRAWRCPSRRCPRISVRTRPRPDAACLQRARLSAIAHTRIESDVDTARLRGVDGVDRCAINVQLTFGVVVEQTSAVPPYITDSLNGKARQRTYRFSQCLTLCGFCFSSTVLTSNGRRPIRLSRRTRRISTSSPSTSKSTSSSSSCATMQ